MGSRLGFDGAAQCGGATMMGQMAGGPMPPGMSPGMPMMKPGDSERGMKDAAEMLHNAAMVMKRRRCIVAVDEVRKRLASADRAAALLETARTDAASLQSAREAEDVDLVQMFNDAREAMHNGERAFNERAQFRDLTEPALGGVAGAALLAPLLTVQAKKTTSIQPIGDTVLMLRNHSILVK